MREAGLQADDADTVGRRVMVGSQDDGDDSASSEPPMTPFSGKEMIKFTSAATRIEGHRLPLINQEDAHTLTPIHSLTRSVHE